MTSVLMHKWHTHGTRRQAPRLRPHRNAERDAMGNPVTRGEERNGAVGVLGGHGSRSARVQRKTRAETPGLPARGGKAARFRSGQHRVDERTVDPEQCGLVHIERVAEDSKQRVAIEAEEPEPSRDPEPLQQPSVG